MSDILDQIFRGRFAQFRGETPDVIMTPRGPAQMPFRIPAITAQERIQRFNEIMKGGSAKAPAEIDRWNRLSDRARQARMKRGHTPKVPQGFSMHRRNGRISRGDV